MREDLLRRDRLPDVNHDEEQKTDPDIDDAEPREALDADIAPAEGQAGEVKGGSQTTGRAKPTR